jgi:hypothetical protein
LRRNATNPFDLRDPPAGEIMLLDELGVPSCRLIVAPISGWHRNQAIIVALFVVNDLPGFLQRQKRRFAFCELA